MQSLTAVTNRNLLTCETLVNGSKQINFIDIYGVSKVFKRNQRKKGAAFHIISSFPHLATLRQTMHFPDSWSG